MKNEYDQSVIEWFSLKNGKITVKIKAKEAVDNIRTSGKVNCQPCHICSSILSHSKRLMSDVLMALDVPKELKKNYGDTDCVYVHKAFYEKLKNV